MTGHWSMDILAGPVGLALFFFFLVGTVGGRLRRPATGGCAVGRTSTRGSRRCRRPGRCWC
ncbi:hypothetical protein KCH_34570 [Kitasatospora cheerisanensis KCTC 2395]|uniref:Uncharacterized protein n=1 Tax=Kitasatospora cheerisanensis KCTC 2395 TaxID=1348663 RepID=A0A066Z434_9ACTN|nr:hypothetical protein KCH_34570 [Kitasatospora cheerisanensis KCTC 2395]